MSTFSTFLLTVYGAVVAVKWLIKTVQNNRENILRIVYNTYNLPETTYQRIKIKNNRNS